MRPSQSGSNGKNGMPARPLKNGPVVLAVLDGWGVAPKGPGNAIDAARTPFLDRARRRYPKTTLMAHGRYVGLLPYQEGNSEAGHMNIGAGRVVRQDIVTVTEAIKDGTFFKNAAFKETLKHAKKYGTAVHLMGLLTDGNSAHAHNEHLYALLKLCADEGMPDVRLHLFTDGRDSPPFSATELLRELEPRLSPGQRIASIMGRFYAMDRNKLWARTALAYHCIVEGKGLVAPSAHTAVLRGYGRGESDEFLIPTVITDDAHRPIGTVGDDDVIIFFNLRSDRARQLTKCFVQAEFQKRNDGGFPRGRVPKGVRFCAMAEFGPDLDHVMTAFPGAEIRRGLTELMAPYRQFYVAESEKYAHVTYFFNGGFDSPRFGERRMRVPSHFVPHHDSRPGMRARAIGDEVARRVKAGDCDLVVLNLANADMVGHTGNVRAAVEAVEAVDAALAVIADAVTGAGGCLAIVGDHGNAEAMINVETGEVRTEHTANPVPFMLVSDHLRGSTLADGMLADVAPTLLDAMDLPKPPEMTGFSLLRP